MDHIQREFFIHRIASGALLITIDGEDFYLKNLDKYQKYKAQVVYKEALKEAELYGLWSEDEVLDMMLQYHFWDIKKEKLLTEHANNIEEFKVGLYESDFQSSSKYAIRVKLQSAKKELEKLTNERHAFDYLTAKSIAIMAKLHYTICNSLYDSQGKKVYSGNEWKDGIISNLDLIIESLNNNRINETEFRDLARNEPWRLTWNSGKHMSLFDGVASDYTEEQKVLIFWSKLYDQIYENPEAPRDEVIEDDDSLDGWLIKQRRIRNREKNKQAGEDFVKNSKIRNADEIFIVAQTPEDAKKIYEMNDAAGSIAIQTTQRLLNKFGSIEHKKLPHVQQLIMERAAELKKHVKGK